MNMGNKKPAAKKATSQKVSASRKKKAAPPPPAKPSIYRRLALFVGLPLLIYFVFFAIYTWPWLPHFNRAFFTDAGDGLQNVWNIWWINKSVTQLHQLPWYTSFLHAPHGVTLLGQTLNPFNGFVAIGLLKFLSLTQAFNVMIIFSFIMAGLTAFWLCYYFSKSYWASLIGGFIFTFSSYHFAHAIGHMQLVSLEWIPLFILLWWKLLKKPSYWLAAGASVVLLLVLFCDYYYFLYSILTAALIFGYFWWSKQLPPLKKWETLLPLGLFGLLSLIMVAPLPFALLRLNSREVLSGSHPARELSTNFLAPFIDGGWWRFSILTGHYWRNVQGTVAESSVYIGMSVLVVALIGWLRRRVINKDLKFWLILGFFFGILSLGPRLEVGRNSIESIPLPYSLLEKVFPPIKLSGVPVRMMVIVTLCSAVIVALTLASFKISSLKSKILLGVFLLVLFLEMFPSPLPLTSNIHPTYAQGIKNLPAGVIFDNAAPTAPLALYDQTLFDKPMVLGYISRTPQSVTDKDWLIVATVLQSRFNQLCSIYKVRYYSTSINKPLNTTYPVVYRDSNVIIYDFKDSPHC